jgi:hypothetical protein
MQEFDQRKQGVRLLHGLAARERDSLQRALLMSTQDQLAYFFNAPIIAGERLTFLVPAKTAPE